MLTCPISSQLEDSHVYSFTAETLKLVAYFERHGARLDAIFAGATPPQYPLEVPMFTLLQESTFTLTKTEDFDAVKGTFADMKRTLADTRSAFPTRWPQSLPNLSTHDTLPAVLRCSVLCVCVSAVCDVPSVAECRHTARLQGHHGRLQRVPRGAALAR